MSNFVSSNSNSLKYNQYHPSLRNKWESQLKSYSVKNDALIENYINWDDPYKNIRFTSIIDFLRGFPLTK
jgi:hypothetical protein